MVLREGLEPINLSVMSGLHSPIMLPERIKMEVPGGIEPRAVLPSLYGPD